MKDNEPTTQKDSHENVSTGNSNEITIEDVARIAGVSDSTVSRVLNDRADVSRSTRQRVQQVIDELGYTPHAMARRLAVRRSRSIALVFPLSDNVSRGEVASFIVRAAFAAEKENYLFSLVASPTTEDRLLGLYRSAQVEGVILMEVHMEDWRVDFLKKNGYPFVMLGRSADNTELSFIDFDFEEGVVLAVDHLVALGHRRIAFVNSHSMREQGYGPAVRAWYGYEQVQDRPNLEMLHFDMDTLSEEISALVELRPSAIIIAIQANSIPELLRAIRQQRYRVPEDISIVCLQADEIAKNLILPMTSVSFDIATAANQASKMLIDQLEGRSSEVGQIVLPPQLIVRESTASVT